MSGIDSSGKRTAAISPIATIDTKNMIVVTGRFRLISAKFMELRLGSGTSFVDDIFGSAMAPRDVVRIRTPVKQVVHHRDHDQSQQRGYRQAADHRNRHRCAHFVNRRQGR